ncbi:hypothetical protein RB195_009141 [Necator americanus]|uniref:Uncharacterized protein n=1 Tax=Necator americanus TaxID=51031 RepID=A0ABR1CTD3_NECAM
MSNYISHVLHLHAYLADTEERSSARRSTGGAMFIAFYSHLLQLHLSRSWITSHNATSSAIERRSRHLRRQEHVGPQFISETIPYTKKVMISTYGSRLVSFHQSYLCRAVSSDRLRILTVMSMQAMFRTLCTTGESSINFSECSDHGFF